MVESRSTVRDIEDPRRYVIFMVPPRVACEES